MSNNKAIMLGLNQTGVIVFILLLLFCIPLCWIPFLIQGMKGDPE